jgi:hypothetical protein
MIAAGQGRRSRSWTTSPVRCPNGVPLYLTAITVYPGTRGEERSRGVRERSQVVPCLIHRASFRGVLVRRVACAGTVTVCPGGCRVRIAPQAGHSTFAPAVRTIGSGCNPVTPAKEHRIAGRAYGVVPTALYGMFACSTVIVRSPMLDPTVPGLLAPSGKGAACAMI